MDINLNVTINAPELCASINNLATSLLLQKTTAVTAVTGVTDIPVDKSNFTFKLADTADADKPVIHNAENVEMPKTGRTDDATRVEPPAADKPETTELPKEEPNQDTGEADNKPATEEPPKEEVQKVEREVIRGVLKAKVDAGKKAQVRAFLDTYGVGISLPNIPEDLVNTEMLAKAEAI